MLSKPPINAAFKNTGSQNQLEILSLKGFQVGKTWFSKTSTFWYWTIKIGQHQLKRARFDVIWYTVYMAVLCVKSTLINDLIINSLLILISKFPVKWFSRTVENRKWPMSFLNFRKSADFEFFTENVGSNIDRTIPLNLIEVSVQYFNLTTVCHD